MATMSDEIIDGDMDNSFDQGSVDVNEVIAEFDGDEGVKIPVKKLSGAFESCLPAQPPAEDSSMRVFLRVRPMKSSSDESTITIRSENTIVTNAPESSRRAQYTKTEERHYVSHFLAIGKSACFYAGVISTSSIDRCADVFAGVRSRV